jgi:hypothetical protein
VVPQLSWKLTDPFPGGKTAEPGLARSQGEGASPGSQEEVGKGEGGEGQVHILVSLTSWASYNSKVHRAKEGNV